MVKKSKKKKKYIYIYIEVKNSSKKIFLSSFHSSILLWNKYFFLIYYSSKTGCKFDFEDGITDRWVRTGTVFNNQPTYGDNPTARNRGQPANQQGNWWIGGYENRHSQGAPAGRIQGDGPQGTLTSPYFTIKGSHISFLIGGGCNINYVRAELIINHRVSHILRSVRISD